RRPGPELGRVPRRNAARRAERSSCYPLVGWCRAGTEKEAVGNEDRVAGQGQKTHSQGCVFTGRRGSYCLVTGASRTFFVAFLVIWRPRLVSPTTEVSVHS